jgi:hypothetical protein
LFVVGTALLFGFTHWGEGAYHRWVPMEPDEDIPEEAQM